MIRNPVIIVASGKSALRANVRRAREYLPCATWIAVNLSVKLIPWCDIHYAGDGQFWRTYGNFPDIKCRKICAQGTDYPEIEKWSVDPEPKWSKRYKHIGNLGNSGAHALNIALLEGATDIALVGFDMCGQHWHPNHTGMLNPSAANLAKWAARFREFEGVRITNCSPVSQITCYPKEEFSAWVDRHRPARNV